MPDGLLNHKWMGSGMWAQLKMILPGIDKTDNRNSLIISPKIVKIK